MGRARMRGVHVKRAIIIFHGSEEGPRPGHQDCEVGECRTRCSRGSNTVVVLAWGRVGWRSEFVHHVKCSHGVGSEEAVLAESMAERIASNSEGSAAGTPGDSPSGSVDIPTCSVSNGKASSGTEGADA